MGAATTPARQRCSKAWTKQSPLGQYARYNLGRRAGEERRGGQRRRCSSRSASRRRPDEERCAPCATNNLALGFAALQAAKPDEARQSLQRGLQGMQSNSAARLRLAAAELKGSQAGAGALARTRRARRQRRRRAGSAHRHPCAYAELGLRRGHREQYNAAIVAYEAEGGRLEESIAAIRSGTLIDGLTERNPGEEMGWFWSIRELPRCRTPAT